MALNYESVVSKCNEALINIGLHVIHIEISSLVLLVFMDRLPVDLQEHISSL